MYSALQPLFAGYQHWYVSYKYLLVMMSVPVFFLLGSFFKMAASGRFNNFQARLNQSTFVFLLFAVGTIFLNDAGTPNTYFILVPFLSYFLSHLFLLIKRRFIVEISFAVFLATLVITNFGGVFNLIDLTKPLFSKDYFLKSGEYQEYRNSKILVIGSNLKPYQYAKMATPFLNWNISKKVLLRPNYYDNLTLVLKGFKEDMPDIILDDHEVMPSLQEKILPLRESYILKSPGVYKRVSN